MKLHLDNLSKVYKQLKVEDGLYLPNFEKNVYKIRNTFEELLSLGKIGNSLLEYKDIKQLLNSRGCLQPKNIVHFTIDSLGFNQILAKNHFLDPYRKENEIIELSSVFPTITSTILTSLHSGLPPEMHGVLGHKILFPEIGSIVNTLIMNVRGSEIYFKDALIKCGVNPKTLLWNYRSPSLFESNNFKQANFLQFDIAGTGLSHLMMEPHSVISFRNLIDGLEKVKTLLKRPEKFYIHFYIGDIDDMCHAYGPFSDGYVESSKMINYILTNFIKSLDKTTANETLLTITADHGQNAIHDDKRIKFTLDDINEYKKYLEVPMGKSGRVLHFYSQLDKIDKVKTLLQDKIGDSGLILTSDDDLSPLFATKKNYNRLTERLGNIIVVFKPHYSAEREYKGDQYKKEPLIKFKMRGTHGSLSEDELIVPFFIDRISNYQNYLENI
ncbi:MAG: hypothetical protein GF329_14500 [Candidatus Lokiarchaeota archaeon]|nr:hypothetical protein [Candidatus Lokiarchaeota archaeon]